MQPLGSVEGLVDFAADTLDRARTVTVPGITSVASGAARAAPNTGLHNDEL